VFRCNVVIGEERSGMRLCFTLRLVAGDCNEVNCEERIGMRFCTTVRRDADCSSEVTPFGD
jgi:hypothetical protein